MTVPTPPPSPIDNEVPAWAVRLEAKVDVVLAQHSTRLDSHAADLLDHENRLRVQEQRSTVSPQALWTAVVSAVTVVAALFGVLSWVVEH